MNHFIPSSAVDNAVPAFSNSAPAAVLAQVHGSLFSSPAWHHVLRRSYGMTIETALAPSGSNVPFCEVDDLRGHRIISLPFSDYCDPQVSTYGDWERLATQIMARGVPTKFKLVRNHIPLDDARFAQSSSELWHATDLTLPEAVLYAKLDDTARRNIRKAERNGVRIRVGRTMDDVRTFYGLHVDVRKSKYHLLAQPVSFFEALHEVFDAENALHVLLAEVDGVPIAGILFLQHGDGLYYKFNASRQLEYRPNDLLIWTGTKLGRELGLKVLDFGISARNQPGLVAFKRKFATEERPVVQLSWSPPGHENPQGTQAGQLLSGLTAMLTEPDVPAALAQRASQLLYPFFC